MPRAATVKLVEEFYGLVWNEGDEAAARRILAPALAFRGSTGVGLTGLGAFLGYVRLVRGALADYRCTIEALVAEEDQAFARLRFAGRHVGTFLGVAPTGRELAWAGAAHFRVEGGVVASIWVLGDVDGLKQQLGLAVAVAP